MADEYINRAKFCEYLRTRKAGSADDYGRGWKNGIIAAERAARGFPAADAAPVVHGRWIADGDGYHWTYNCSICAWKDGYPFNERHNYCPNCGAKMDGAE
nr:MAG TPA_asm: zinc-ribbon containing domain protein [Caudoviricetes sp.]